MKKETFKPICFNFLVGITLLCLFQNCSKDNPDNEIIFQYAADSLEVEFRTQGNIPPPEINWPGNKGTFSLKIANPGLEIDTESGAIAWNKDLELGLHEITVYAISEKGTGQSTLILNNVLGDSFLLGGLSNQENPTIFGINRNLWLNKDGTLEIEIIDAEDSKGVGVWAIEGNSITMHLCTYCDDMDPNDIPSYDEHTYLEGVIGQDEEGNTTIRGKWYVIRFDPDSQNLRGDFIFFFDGLPQ